MTGWEEITSRENSLIKQVKKLSRDGKYRAERAEYVCEGGSILREALDAGADIRAVLWESADLDRMLRGDPELFTRLESAGGRKIRVTEAVYDSLNILENYSGPIFICGIPEEKPLTGRQFIALDTMQDPGNVGTIIRTAHALGLNGVYLLDGCADPYGPKAARAAMGSLFRIPVRRVTADEFFRETQGIPVLAAALDDGAAPLTGADLGSCAVVIGNEGNGIHEEVMARCDGKIVIPMPGGAQSLNAAAAAAIIMWEMSRTKQAAE